MQPRSDGVQRCLHFALTTRPRARILTYQDHDGNNVHFFNSPAPHGELTVTAEALVDCVEPDRVPEADLRAWAALDAARESGEWWEYLAPSPFACPSPRLERLARRFSLASYSERRSRAVDPLVLLRRVMDQMHEHFEYRPQTTRVDSPIEEALAARRGVCQDFAHIFIALVRPLGIPARYVSGYLFHRDTNADRSADGATHAWVEALLPPFGWIGFDPTNNIMVGERHIRVAIGRDYSDVPPTKGVYKGVSAVRADLAVAVQVGADAAPFGRDLVPFTPWVSRAAGAPLAHPDAQHEQQQQ